jgi:hypothetical protein
MNQNTNSNANRPRKAHPLFVNLFLNANVNEEREDEVRVNRRGNQRQKLVMRNF